MTKPRNQATAPATKTGMRVAPKTGKGTAANTAPEKTAKTTKIETVRVMLAGPDGATLAALCDATGWQKHTVRAAISRFRKDGANVERRAIDDATAYRIVTSAGEAGAGR